MRKLKSAIYFFVIIILFNPSFSQVVSKFDQANDLYKKGDYKSAIELFEGILSEGYESSEIYYNLGNCYYKDKNIAPAILNYERAKKLSPGDNDINFNLNVANLKVVDKIEPVPKFFVYTILENLRDMFSSDSWAIFAIILSWVTFGIISCFFLVFSPLIKKILFAFGLIFFISTILTAAFGYQTYNSENAKDSAIIFSPSVYVKSSPESSGTDLFILHEGTKLKIMDTVNNWFKIRLANGTEGWLPEDTIKII